MGDTAVAGQVTSWSDSWLIPVLQQAGILTELDIPRLRETGARSAWSACLAAGVASDEWILNAVSARFRLPLADVEATGAAAAALLPGELARRHRVVPLAFRGQVLDVACADPTDMDLERAVAFGAGHRVRLHLAAPAAIELTLARLYPSGPSVEADVKELVGLGDCRPGEGLTRELEEIVAGANDTDPPIPELVNALIVRGIRLGASDLHLEPTAQALVARYRVDGILHEIARMPRAVMAPLISRLKVMANLDIADRMRPQDGRAQALVDSRRVDLRISSLPISGMGEKVVVRILDSSTSTVRLDRLGFDPAELVTLNELLTGREGLVLVTGPTGCGKTTTLYAALRSVQTSEVNVVTVEDPIEYRLEGISQVQVNEKAGLTFATTLRSILRQDPDVVLVGEIRDRETADVAIQAALTGHLVLSTLHTTDAATTIMRLVDMGVDVSSLSAALRGVVAQRLIRRVCPACRRHVVASQLPLAQQALLAGVDVNEVYSAVGCPECHGTGYRGRLAVAEIAVVDANVQRAIAHGGRIDDMVEACKQAGMKTVWECGIRRVAQGVTTLHELLDNVAAPQVAASAPSGGPSTDGALCQDDIDALVQRMLAERGGAAPAAATTEAPAASAPAQPPAPADRPHPTASRWQIEVDAVIQQALASPPATPADAAPLAPPVGAAPPAPPVGAAPQAPPVEAPLQPSPGVGRETGTAVPAASSARSERPRILVVDDDGEARRALREGLTAEGFRVVEASDGETALEYVRRLRPDAIVMELALPRVDGFGILKAMAEGAAASGTGPRCIVLTVQDDPDVASWAAELGAADYLVKPVTARALAARLRAQLEATA